MATATAQTTDTPAQRELERRMLRQMLLIRRFEEKAAEAYALGKIGGLYALDIGKEAGGPRFPGRLRDHNHNFWPLPRDHHDRRPRSVASAVKTAVLL